MLSPQDMHRFWGIDHKIGYERILSRLIVPGRFVNLSQLDKSNYLVSRFFKAKILSILFTLCGLVFEDVVRLFYANHRVSNDSGELETLFLGNRLIFSEPLFVDVFDTKFFGVIPCMNSI